MCCLLGNSVLLETLDRGTGETECQSFDIARTIITSIACLEMSNVSSRRDFAAFGKQRKRVVAHHRFKDYLHISVTNVNVEVCFDRLFHV
jgi:hypothetical protein